MSVQDMTPTAALGLDRLSRSTRAALVCVLVGALCLLLTPSMPWLVKYPLAWTLPATEWIGTGLGGFLEFAKPLARFFSSLLAYPMAWANAIFATVPWPLMIALVTALGWLTGQAEFDGVFSLPPSPAPALLKLDIAGALNLSMVTVILTLLLVDVFDTAGTMVGVANRAGLIDERGHLPRLGKALLADSGATVFGALAGTSSTTSYIESASGVEAGGRSGLTAVICGLLFLACLMFAPLARSIPAYATAAALLFVACLMVRSLASLDWDDLTESAPAVITALAMPLTFSIADAIGLGFIAYAGIKLLSGRQRECPGAVTVIALVFALKFAFL